MPVSDDRYRSYSLECVAHYVPYVQPENLCAGLTAMWLRNAVTMKGHFWDKHSNKQGREVEVRDEKVTVQDFAMKPESMAKAKKLQNTFSDPDNEVSRKKDQEFIVAGSRGIKKSNPNKAYAQKIFTYKIREINDIADAAGNIDNLKLALNAADDEKGFLRISVDLCNGQGSHALAADFHNLQPRARYFDPLLGDFLFPTADRLIAWWARCYNARDVTNRLGAFDFYGKQFWAVRFQIFNTLGADGKFLRATELESLGDLY